MERIRSSAARAIALGVVLASWMSGVYMASAQDVTTSTRISLTPVTVDAGLLTRPTMTFGALWSDYDRDGFPDLFVDRHYKNSWLYQNLRGRLDLQVNPFLTQNDWKRDTPWVDRHGCAWGEATGGGGLDLFCTQGANKGEGAGANQLFNSSGRNFGEIAVRIGVDDPKGRGRSANWLDYDTDGDLDLFVTNAIRQGFPNRLFRNDRGGFREVPTAIEPSKTEWPTSTVADWDSDGDFDIAVLDGMYGIRAYRNDDGRFVPTQLTGLPDADWVSATWADYDGDGWIDVHLVDRSHAVVMKNVAGAFVPAHEIALSFGRSSAWFDVENDGDLDLFVVQGTPPPAGAGNTNYPDFLLLNEPTGFRRVDDPAFRGPRDGNGDQVVTSDYDRDGRTDLFVTNGHNPSRFFGINELFRNTTAAGGSVTLRLRGDAWNPMGIGTRILVETGGRTSWYSVTDGVTHRGQSEVDNVVIGLGDAPTASIVVFWPTGEKDCYVVDAGTTVIASKGVAGCDPNDA